MFSETGTCFFGKKNKKLKNKIKYPDSRRSNSNELSQRALDKVDGWKTCKFTSFFTVFQSYQDNGWVIINDCVQNPFMIKKIPTLNRAQT